MKRCPHCELTKTLAEFYPLKRHPGLVMSWCIVCWKEKQQKISRLRAARETIELPESVVCQTCKRELPASMFALNRTRARGCQSRCKDCHREQRYGLRPGEYDARLTDQNGTCAICHEPPVDGRQLEVDHCHDTNQVRGLLCGPCNRMLGAARDRVKTLLAAVDYLEGGGSRHG